MAFPQHVIEEIRNQADIVRIVSDYVALKKRGSTYIACCPFHQEKSPSFNVHPAKQMFKCFGCGVAGSVFTFVMNIEHVPFPEAVRLIAQKCGLELPQEEVARETREAELERERLLQLHDWAAEFFQEQLERPEAKFAQTYLMERSITEATVRLLRLGYAPDRWDAMGNYLKKRGATTTEIEKSGLVTVKESGTGFYDRFRGRLMFPITDNQGRVVAFGGRILGEGEPKYLNSPETLIYTKGRHLYGLYLAKESIRKNGFVILVEGYFDFALPFQEGVGNIVASLGTALTENQVRLMRRFLERPQVIINFDPDRAGQAATERSLELFLEHGFKVNVLHLPSNETKFDPDTYVRTLGVDAYRKQLKNSQPFVEYLLERASLAYDLHRPQGKVAAVNDILPFLARIKEPIERAVYAERLADRLKLDDALIREELKKAAAGQRTALSPQKIEAVAAIPPVERQVLRLMLSDWEFCRWGLEQLPESFTHKLESGLLFQAVRRRVECGQSLDYDGLSALLTNFQSEQAAREHPGQPNLFRTPSNEAETSPLHAVLAEILLEADPPQDEETRHQAYAQLTAGIQALERQQMGREQSQLQFEVEQAQKSGNQELAIQQAMQKLEKLRRMNKLT
ncbi:MAG: DNA primase [Blastocatellia bacterium]|nr:DNA primase [Blastocatellia bacterium]